MLIRPVKNEIDKIEDLKTYNIKEAKRYLMLFVDKNAVVNPEMFKTARLKAIQINIAVQTSIVDDTVSRLGVLTTNNTLVRTGVYVYDVLKEVNTPITDVSNMVFNLTDAYSNQNVNDMDTGLGRDYETGLYHMALINNEELLDKLNNSWLNNTTNIPPIYYTEREMHHKDNEHVYDILWDGNMVTYMGKELIDSNTSIGIYDIKKWPSMKSGEIMENIVYANSNNDFLFESINKITDDTNLSRSNFPHASQSMLNGVTFIHDTDLGNNIKSSNPNSIVMAKYKSQPMMMGQMEYIKDVISFWSKHLEKKHGPMRLFYNAALDGDSYKIQFKDYNPDNQPINSGKTIRVDRGFTTTDFLSDIAKAAEMDETLRSDDISWEIPDFDM